MWQASIQRKKLLRLAQEELPLRLQVRAEILEKRFRRWYLLILYAPVG